MGVPYTYRNVFSIFNNEQKCIALKVPSRGTIKSVVISQEVGTVEGFAFEIFTNRDVCPPDTQIADSSSSSSSSSAGSTPAEELFSLFGRKSTGSKVFVEFEKDYLYTCEGGSTNRKRELYMRFTPDGANTDAKEFHMKLDIEQTDIA